MPWHLLHVQRMTAPPLPSTVEPTAVSKLAASLHTVACEPVRTHILCRRIWWPSRHRWAAWAARAACWRGTTRCTTAPWLGPWQPCCPVQLPSRPSTSMRCCAAWCEPAWSSAAPITAAAAQHADGLALLWLRLLKCEGLVMPCLRMPQALLQVCMGKQNTAQAEPVSPASAVYNAAVRQ